MHLLHEGAGPLQEPGKIRLGRLADEAVVGELLSVAHEARRVREHAGRYAAIIGAGAAYLSALDESDLGPELPGAQRRRHPRGPTTHHDNLVHHSFLSASLVREL